MASLDIILPESEVIATLKQTPDAAELIMLRRAGVTEGEKWRRYPHLDQTIRIKAFYNKGEGYLVFGEHLYRLKYGSVGGLDCQYLIKGWPRTSIAAAEFQYYNEDSGNRVSSGLIKIKVKGTIEHDIPVYAVEIDDNSPETLPNAAINDNGYVEGTFKIGTGMMATDWINNNVPAFYYDTEFKFGMRNHIFGKKYPEIRDIVEPDRTAGEALATKNFKNDPLKLER